MKSAVVPVGPDAITDAFPDSVADTGLNDRDDTTIAGRLPGRRVFPPNELTDLPPIPVQAQGGSITSSGLGTDLFGMQSAMKTDTGSRIRVIILITIAFVTFLVLVVLAMAAFGGNPPKPISARPSTAPATPSAPAAGLRRHTDVKGFTIDVPKPLKTGGKGDDVIFRLTGDPRYVRVNLAPHSSKDIVQAVRDAEAKDTYTDYKLIRIKPVQPTPYPSTNVADWEFNYTSAGGTRWHALSRWVSVPDGASYAIYWIVPQANWETYAKQRTAVLASFTPARKKLPGGS